MKKCLLLLVFNLVNVAIFRLGLKNGSQWASSKKMIWLLYTGHVSVQTDQRPMKGGLMRLSFLPFIFFLSLRAHVTGFFWFLHALGRNHIWNFWDVYTPRGGGGNNQNTYLFHSESTLCLTSPSQSWERQYGLIKCALAVIYWLLSREYHEFDWTVCHSYQFSEVTAQLSPDLTCEKQVVQLGDLPPSCSSQACKHSSVMCMCCYVCFPQYVCFLNQIALWLSPHEMSSAVSFFLQLMDKHVEF